MNSKGTTVPLILGILILTSSSGFHLSPLGYQAAHAESVRVVGYFPQWESGDVNSIDYSQVTDIIYFHIWPNSDGSLVTTDVNFSDLNTITNNAHSSGVKVLIAAGGWGVSDGFPAMASDPTSRANFVQNVKSFILANNLDGIDIDWETTINSEKINNQDILLADLANELHPIGKLVTVAVNGDVVELKSSASDSVDWVNVMAYDMNWNNAEHSTFDDSVDALQRYENAGIPKGDLNLGIPFYGRSDGWSSEMKYEDIVSACTPETFENYCNGHFFNGIDLVKQKTQYVLDNSYDGVMIWNLGQDTYDQTSLLNAINEVLDSPPLPDMPPTANDDNYSINAQTNLNEPSPGVLSNDNEPNNDPIVAVLDSDVNNGILTLNPDGSFSYSPNPDFDGVDSFTYHAHDGTNNSNTATVSITVNPIIKIHLENLAGESNGKKRWTGTATITVFDETETPFAGASVTGSWEDGSAASCVTDLQGQCQVSKVSRNNTQTFTLNNISGNNAIFEPNVHNIDNSIVIYREGISNQPPTADAGANQTVTDSDDDGSEVVTLDGSGSDDSDGTITSYEWKDSSDSVIGNTVSISPAVPLGTHVYTLTVTDDGGLTDIDTVSVSVESPSTNPLSIDEISPNSMIKGETISVTLYGTGFGTESNPPTVTFGGAKWAPSSTIVSVSDSEIVLEVWRTGAGPNKTFVYDVTVTNFTGDSVTLQDSFTVLPP